MGGLTGSMAGELEGPSVYSERNILKSRKVHKCSECHTSLPIGTPHRYIWGVWDGEPTEYRRCMPCCKLMDELVKYMPSSDIPMKGLLGEISYLIQEPNCPGILKSMYEQRLEELGKDFSKVLKDNLWELYNAI